MRKTGDVHREEDGKGRVKMKLKVWSHDNAACWVPYETRLQQLLTDNTEEKSFTNKKQKDIKIRKKWSKNREREGQSTAGWECR